MIKYLKVHKVPGNDDDIPPKWVVSGVEDCVPYRVEFDNPVDADYEFRTIADFTDDMEVKDYDL